MTTNDKSHPAQDHFHAHGLGGTAQPILPAIEASLLVELHRDDE